MKCPKCKYVAFDYLDVCPRCGKDLTAEKAKLNISSVKPNPPLLLGSLTGDLDDSSMEFRVPGSVKKGAEQTDLKGEEIYDDGSELNINFDEEPPSGSGGEFELDLDDLGPSDEGKAGDIDFSFEKAGPEFTEGAGEEKEAGEQGPGLEDAEDEVSAEKKQTGKDSGEVDLDLDDLDLKLDFDEDEDSDD